MSTIYRWNPATVSQYAQIQKLLDGTEFRANGDSLHALLKSEGYTIGRRSGAGLYCWDCKRTLCRRGKTLVHHTRNRNDWNDSCPRCGKTWVGSREPGRLMPAQEGVQIVCSFTWEVDPEEVRGICLEHPDSPIISNEYGVTLTGSGFLEMLRVSCPIELGYESDTDLDSG